MAYTDYLKSSDWAAKRRAKLTRKGGKKLRCAICASTERLEVHHLNYKSLYDVKQEDLRLFCRRCHSLTHDLMKRGKIVFTSEDHRSRFAFVKNALKRELGITNTNMFRDDRK